MRKKPNSLTKITASILLEGLAAVCFKNNGHVALLPGGLGCGPIHPQISRRAITLLVKKGLVRTRRFGFQGRNMIALVPTVLGLTLVKSVGSKERLDKLADVEARIGTLWV